MNWAIYSLSDPRDMRVRYVGMTTKGPHKRLSLHICNAKVRDEGTHRGKWIRAVLAAGLRPQVTVLETGSGDWVEAEQRWIAEFRAAGAQLVNATDGGEGRVGSRISAEHRAKMAAGLRRRFDSDPELCKKAGERLGQANLGRKLSEGQRRAISAFHKARVKTPEEIAKVAAKLRGVPKSIEARANMSASAKVKIFTPEHRAKMAASRVGRKASAEHRANMSAGIKAAKRRSK